MIRRYLPRSTEELIRWYERYIAPLALIGGFLLDTFVFLDRVDLLSGNLLLLSYLLIASSGIVLVNLIETGKWTGRFPIAIAPFVPVVVQFAFGALFSGYLSLYSRSASLAVSWIFVIVVAGLLLGNERFRRLYVRFRFQIAILFTSIFTFLIFLLPIILHRIGPWMFVLAGVSSLLIIAAFLYVLHRVVPEVERRERSGIMRTIAAIFIGFNILYFTNAIPPLPLALKDAGVYHRVVRVGTEYQLSAEIEPWFKKFLPLSKTTFHRTAGDSAYAFSSVFAPTGLTTVIVHEWQHYDESAGEWVTDETIRFSILGGRDGGYRGYSIKSDLTSGHWRVNVLTEYGQTIGRIAFIVEDVLVEPELTVISK